MRRKISIAPNQPPRDAELMEVDESSETWCTYKLSDGTTLKIKQVAMEIWRIIDAFDPEGNPQYFVKSAGVMSVIAPEELRKKVE